MLLLLKALAGTPLNRFLARCAVTLSLLLGAPHGPETLRIKS